MPDKRDHRNKAIALTVTILVHTAIIAGLFFLFLPMVQAEEREGILVNIGDSEFASGMFMPHQLEPDYVPPASPEPALEPSQESYLTQDTPDAPILQTEEQNIREQEERARIEEQRRRDERRRQEEAEAQRRREEIQRNVSGAFGNTQRQGSGTSQGAEAGRQGSPQGNVTSGGVDAGVGGFGSFALDGRSLVGSGLQRPSYNVQVSGTIVIEITVNPAGQVVQALIAQGTTVDNNELRQSALKAARLTRFNAIDGLNNQVGTITYRFRLN